MSKDLKTLKGKIETVTRVDNRLEPFYPSREVNLTSFYGGEERGKCLHLSFNTLMHDNVHIQLDNATVKELIKILQENFND